jgi:hypothetical protein
MAKINRAVVVGSEEWERFVAEAKNLPTLDSKRWHALKEWGDGLSARLSAGGAAAFTSRAPASRRRCA